MEKIVGVNPVNGKIIFTIKWKNIRKTEKIESIILYEKVPQLIIEFYQSIIMWIDDSQLSTQRWVDKDMNIVNFNTQNC